MAAATSVRFIQSRLLHRHWLFRSRHGFSLRYAHTRTQNSRRPFSKHAVLLASLTVFGTSGVVYAVQKTMERKHTSLGLAKCQESSNEKLQDTKETKDHVNIINSRSHSIKSLQTAIKESQLYVSQLKEETGTPGVVVTVSVDGAVVWSEGFGYADVENNVKCSPKTVMRIASISKTLTATALAKLYEENKMDLDAPIQKYIPDFPQKRYKDEPVIITTRQLLSHLGGIRHYEKPSNDKKEEENKHKEGKDSDVKNESDQEKNCAKNQTQQTQDIKTTSEPKSNNQMIDNNTSTDSTQTNKKKKKKKAKKEFENAEYYIKEPKTLAESLALFKDDHLVAKPGEEYLYTTHGYTLVSGVVQAAAKEDFIQHMKKFFCDLGMKDTKPEYHDKITYHRARQYIRNKRHGLVNAPYVDNSYKWAGGGFISTAEDLVRFGNSILYAKQFEKGSNQTPGILKPETVEEMWKVVKATEGMIRKNDKHGWYGWGWFVLPEKTTCGCGRHQKEAIFHTGSAVGGVSVLLLLPDNQPTKDSRAPPPRGIVVAILMNQQDVSRSVADAARDIATIFDEYRSSSERET